MSSFTRLPPLEAIPPAYVLYKTTIDFEYHVGSEDSGEVITIEEGFITDGASIPKFAWSVIGGPMGKYAAAAVVHDYLYKVQSYTRKKADLIFYEAMQVLKVPFWKRWLMHKAVRVAGWRPWNRYRDRGY